MVAKQEPGAAKPKRPPEITRALRVELAKPLAPHTWDEVGRLLRAQLSVQYRALNSAILAAFEYAGRARRGEPVGIFRGADRRDGIPNPDTATYRGYEEGLAEIRAWAKRKLEKRGDDEDPRHLEWLASEDLFTSGAQAVSGRLAYSRFRQWQKENGKTRIPSWGEGAPLFCRAADEVKLSIDRSGKVTLRLRHALGYEVTWAVRAGKGSQYGRLRELALGGGSRRIGNVTVKRDDRNRKWFAFISYSEPKPVPPDKADPDHVLILHRGQRNLLVAMSNRGRYLRVASGWKIRSMKRKFYARRQGERRISLAERGAGARGHGSGRRYQTRDALEQREKNWLRTELQRLGKRVADLALQWGTGTVLIEDYGGIEPSDSRAERRFLERFPNHQMKECIAWSLQKVGLTLGEYASEFISQTCPKCGQEDSAQHNHRTGVFHCSRPSCGFERDVDFVACLHALRRSCQGNAGEWEKRLKLEAQLTDEIRNAGKERQVEDPPSAIERKKQKKGKKPPRRK